MSQKIITVEIRFVNGAGIALHLDPSSYLNLLQAICAKSYYYTPQVRENCSSMINMANVLMIEVSNAPDFTMENGEIKLKIEEEQSDV